MMRYAIWYHLHNLKNVKNAHGGVLLLVKLQAFNCSSFLKSQIATIYILHLSGIWHLCVYWFIIYDHMNTSRWIFVEVYAIVSIL